MHKEGQAWINIDTVLYKNHRIQHGTSEIQNNNNSNHKEKHEENQGKKLRIISRNH